MDAKDYPLSLNPAYQESEPEKAWLSHRREIEDLGEGYTSEVTYFIREDFEQIDITKVRVLKKVNIEVIPSEAELLETAQAFLRSEFGDEIEFV